MTRVIKHIQRALLFIIIPIISVGADLPIGSVEDRGKIYHSDTTVYNHRLISLKSHYGSVLGTNDFVKGENSTQTPINSFIANDIRYSIETTGNKEWHHIYNFPKYGVGIYHARFFNTDGEKSNELGTPLAIYGFLNGSLHRFEQTSLNYEVGFGLAWNWEPYHHELNHHNVAIGAGRTVFINLGLDFTYRLSSRFDLTAALNVSHFSNGGTVKPNKGINLFAPSLELSYRIKGDGERLQRAKIPFKKSRDEFYIFGAASSKQISWDALEYGAEYMDINFAVGTLSGGWLRQISYGFKTGLGLDLSYDASTNAKLVPVSDKMGLDTISYRVSEAKTVDKLTVGAIGNIEAVMGSVSAWVGIGAYVWRGYEEETKPIIYQRVGVKYHFKNNLFTGVNVRAYHFGVADYLEWSIGYRFIK